VSSIYRAYADDVGRRGAERRTRSSQRRTPSSQIRSAACDLRPPANWSIAGYHHGDEPGVVRSRRVPGARAEGRVSLPLPIIDGHAATVPNAALPGLAASELVRHIALDRLIVGTMERTGAAVGATAGDWDNVVWGTACNGEDCPSETAWNTSDGYGVVWGSTGGDTVVWGSSGTDPSHNVAWNKQS
jgi:hypothetical protein